MAATTEELTTALATVAELQVQMAEVHSSIDNGWTIFGGVLVFLMHAGFALLEAGTVRQKNMLNILQKNSPNPPTYTDFH